jgi:WD40 repeat protein
LEAQLTALSRVSAEPGGIRQRYNAAVKRIQDIESLRAEQSRVYRPTSQTVMRIQQELSAAQNDRNEAARELARVLIYSIKSKQAAYDKLVSQMFPDAPQAKALASEVQSMKHEIKGLFKFLDRSLFLDAVVSALNPYELFRTLPFEGLFSRAVFSPDSTRILTYNKDDPSALLWDLQSGEKVHSFTRAHGDGVSVAAFSRNGSRILISVGPRGSIITDLVMWNAQTGEKVLTFEHDGTISVSHIAFAPDDLQIITAGYTSVDIWDAQTGKRVRSFPIQAPDWSRGAAISPNADRVVIGWGEQKTVRKKSTYSGGALLWDVRSGQQPLILQHKGYVGGIAFSPDGLKVAICGIHEDKVSVWDTEGGEMLYSLETGRNVSTVAFSPVGHSILTGKWILAPGEGKGAVLWDSKDGKELCTVDHLDVDKAAFSTDGNYLLISDLTLSVWNARTFQHLHTYPRDDMGFRDHLASSPNSVFACACSRNQIYILYIGAPK